MNIIVVILVSIIILFAQGSIIIISIKRRIKNVNQYSEVVNISAGQVGFSIIIAARNEKENVKKLVNTLNNLIYPKDKYEVIIVDDNSTDGTLEELKLITGRLNNFITKELKTTSKRGKRDALSFGIENSQFPYLLITDADCWPQSSWLMAYSDKFNLGYEMLLGIAPFYQVKNFTNKISCFENLRASLLSFSMASIGLPYTATARNFGFARSAFNLIGGYSNTKNTLSGDDDLLLREAVKRKLKIGTVTEPGSFVYSETKKTLREYLHQKARHTQTSFHYLWKHQIILGFWHLFNLFLLLSPLMILINPFFGILLPLKLFFDFITVKSTQKKIGYKFSMIEILYLQFFYEILLIIHFVNARFSKITWK